MMDCMKDLLAQDLIERKKIEWSSYVGYPKAL
jgi:hypothetical protein